MSRRSSRIKRLPRNNVVENEVGSDFEPEGASEPEFKVERVARRSTPKTTARTRKASGRPTKRRRGKLRQMLDMPLDVVMEICSHLFPKDLLNLARTSKSLRTFFMSRSSQHMWKAACSSVPGLPSCPPDLSEPAYVNLLFDTHCHFCQKKNCNKAGLLHLEVRLRLCRDCYGRLNSNTLFAEYSVASALKVELSNVPGSHKLHDVLPNIRGVFLRTHVANLIELFNDMPSDARAELLDVKRKQLSELRKHTLEMYTWLGQSAISRAEELRELKDSRSEAIMERLREDGWQAEIDYLKSTFNPIRYEFATLPEVRKSQALTPKIWNNIKGPVTEFIQKVRNQRVTAERKEIIKHRLVELSEFVDNLPLRIPGLYISRIDTVHYIPETSQLIDPDNPTFDPQDLEVPIKNCLQNRAQQTLNSLRKQIIQQCRLDESTNPFSLAVGSWFMCNLCRTIQSLEQVGNHMGHDCRSDVPQPTHVPDEIYDIVKWKFHDRLWSAGWYNESVPVMPKIVEACGLDPKTATIDDLDRADVRLRWARDAHQEPDWKPIMTWRSATRMAGVTHSRVMRKAFERATEAEIAAAKPLEATALALCEREWDEDVKFLCRQCSVASYMSKAQIIVHIRDRCVQI
ncbi:hypothetical protein BC629DRAFT_805936 [Irpex lacteus]|nr:hypothetical protein BC629DRAFT_805936 [Irpex lacteus]